MSPAARMNLKVLLPSQVFLDTPGVSRIVAETSEGSYGILPNRLDCVAALVPGILTWQTDSGGEAYLAVDEGILVKTGGSVLVSVRQAIGGADLAHLREAVVGEFRAIDEQDREVRAAMAKLETGLIRRFMDLQHE